MIFFCVSHTIFDENVGSIFLLSIFLVFSVRFVGNKTDICFCFFCPFL